MFFKKFQLVSQVVGAVTLLVLALYGLMGHPQDSAAAFAAEIVPLEMSISENAPSAQWGDSTVPLVMDYKGGVIGRMDGRDFPTNQHCGVRCISKRDYPNVDR